MKRNPTKRQTRLAALLSAAPGTIRVDDATNALGMDRAQASRQLAAWHRQGVIRRVAHGVYVPVSPTALGQTQVLDDPWVLVPELYNPGYVGGWSALEHWELTEQVFRSVCVLTTRRVRSGEAIHQGVGFFIKQIPDASLFGTKPLWRGSTKILVSDPHKTMLDVIDDPVIGAGLQHTLDCLREYARRFDSQAARATLLDYAARIGNGALYKKLGYLAERLGFEKAFINSCRDRITKGYSFLDKNAKDPMLVTRWRLWVPRSIDVHD